jgi:hypothetical protein
MNLKKMTGYLPIPFIHAVSVGLDQRRLLFIAETPLCILSSIFV